MKKILACALLGATATLLAACDKGPDRAPAPKVEAQKDSIKPIPGPPSEPALPAPKPETSPPVK